MKKIKVLVAVALVSTLIGVTSFAEGTVQKAKSPEIYDVLNNNADVLSDHIDNIAGTDVLGHVKIGSGLQAADDGTASVKLGSGLQSGADGSINAKIANDLSTDDSETALSAAMGVQLGRDLEGIKTDLKKFDILANYAVIKTGTKITLNENIKNYKYVLCLIGSSNDSKAGLETLIIPTSTIDGISNEFCGLHNHYGLKDHYTEYQIGFTSDDVFEACYVNNVGSYELAISLYGMN